MLHMRPPQGANDVDPDRRNNGVTPAPIFIVPDEVEEESKTHKDGEDKEKVPPSPRRKKRESITSFK